jgi:predicted nucleotidyltransferase
MRIDRQRLREVSVASGVVDLCVLFGSEVTGRHGVESDVDVGIWPARPLNLQWLFELRRRQIKEKTEALKQRVP